MFTQSIARLPDNIELSYTDSGPVADSGDYTTVIVIHGSAFNGRGFEKLHDFSPKYNMRTIILQRRDYPGSTNYTDDDLDDLKNGRKVFMDRIAIQLAQFCQHLVQNLHIPLISSNGKAGGICIMGWSFGAATAMAMFSVPDLLPHALSLNLEKYIRSLVLYDPPYLACGYELPDGCQVYNPWPNPTENQTTEDLYRAFKSWVSSYYTVPDDWSGNINNLDHRSYTEKTTLDLWSQEEHNLYFTMEAALRSEWNMYREPMQTTLRNMACQILYNEDMAKSSFPAVSVVLLCPSRTNWQCFWGCWVTQQLHKEHKARGQNIRPLLAIQLKDRNHFAHYDFPDEFLEAVQAAIN